MVHDKPLVESMGGPHSYGVKCNLSVKATQILREDGEMNRHCNCDKANLPLSQSTGAKRKECDDSDGNASKHKKSVETTGDDTIMFDYNAYIEEAGRADATDESEIGDQAGEEHDQDGEETVPGMNFPGFTTTSTYTPPLTDAIDNVPPETTSVKSVTKKESFYVQTVDGNIVIDDSDDEETAIPARNTRMNAGQARGFEQGEVIVIDDD
jgi:hypothetical protein